MHHIQDGQTRKVNLIVYSGAPTGSFPIPRNLSNIQQNVHVPMLSGFSMLEHGEGGPILMKHGVEFKLHLEFDGVHDHHVSVWKHESSYIAWQKFQFDIQNVPPGHLLHVKISRRSTARIYRTQDGMREYTLEQKRLPLDFANLDIEREKGKDVDLTYWTGVQEYSPDSAKITCGYCLNTDLCQEPSQKVAIKGAGKLLVGPCCKGIQSILLSGAVNAEAEPAEPACAEPAAGAGGPRRETSAPQPPTAQGKPVIEGFFCKRVLDKRQLRDEYEKLEKGDAHDKEQQLRELNQLIMDSVESIDVHKEAQELQSLLSGGRSVFEVKIHPQPSFDTFSKSMRSARERNVRLLHLSGHGGSRCGFFWLKDQTVSTEYEEISIDKFVGILRTEVAGANGGSIECAVLNACETEDMGKKLRSAGVSHVVCWRSEVQDNTAREFALAFYASLDEQDPLQQRNYQLAFRRAVARISSGGGAARAPKKHLADGAVDYVCLLSEDGDEFPDTGHIWQGEEEGDSRNFLPPKDNKQFGALAGQQELLALNQLGFDVGPMQSGQGLNDAGFVKQDVMWQKWGVGNYTHLWGREGKVVHAAAAVAPAKRQFHGPRL